MNLLEFCQLFFGLVDNFFQFGFAGFFGFFEQRSSDVVNFDYAFVGECSIGFLEGECREGLLRNFNRLLSFSRRFAFAGSFFCGFFGRGFGFGLVGQLAFIIGDGNAIFFDPFRSTGGTAWALGIFYGFVLVHIVSLGLFSEYGVYFTPLLYEQNHLYISFLILFQFFLFKKNEFTKITLRFFIEMAG